MALSPCSSFYWLITLFSSFLLLILCSRESESDRYGERDREKERGGGRKDRGMEGAKGGEEGRETQICIFIEHNKSLTNQTRT